MSAQLFLVLSAIFVLFTINSSLIDGASQTAFNYKVVVSTAATKFDDHKGKLKLSMLWKKGNFKTQDDFQLTPNDVKLESKKNYTSNISTFAPIANITSVYLRWTLASPYNPIYAISKPSIYFDPIVLSTSVYDTNLHMTLIQIRKYCAPTSPVAIKHADGANFYPCS